MSAATAVAPSEVADESEQSPLAPATRSSLNTDDPKERKFLAGGLTPVSARLRGLQEAKTLLDDSSPWWQVEGHARKHAVWMFVNEPASSPWAFRFTILILFLILLNTLALLAETMPEFDGVSQASWDIFEGCCMFVFLIEIGMRAWSSVSWKDYLSDALNLLDVLIVLFWLLGLLFAATGFGDVRVIRLLRLVRVARVFKLSRFSGTIHLLLEVITKSTQSLLLLLFFVFVTIVVFSSAIYFIEGGEPDEKYIARNLRGNPFTSIPETVYWCVVTVTSIGYGDIYPVTDPGRGAAIIAVIVGSVVVAMPLSVISTHFLKATRTLEQETAEKLARATSKFALGNLNRVASMRATHYADVVVQGEPPEGSLMWAEKRLLRLLDDTEARWDRRIDLLVHDLTKLHQLMLDNGMLTAKLAWR